MEKVNHKIKDEPLRQVQAMIIPQHFMVRRQFKLLQIPISFLVLSIISACNNNNDESKDTEPVTTQVSCKVATSDTTHLFAVCPCVELSAAGDTISRGMYQMDMRTRVPYKFGWHIREEEGLFYHEHYTLLEKADTLIENLDQIVCKNLQGDTLNDKSSYVVIDAPKVLKLGEEFVARFRYQSPIEMETYFEVSKLVKYDSLININAFDAVRNNSGQFVFRCIPQYTGHFEMNSKIVCVPLIEEKDSSEFLVSEIFYYYDFNVIE